MGWNRVGLRVGLTKEVIKNIAGKERKIETARNLSSKVEN
jgi:hypothetical protein